MTVEYAEVTLALRAPDPNAHLTSFGEFALVATASAPSGSPLGIAVFGLLLVLLAGSLIGWVRRWVRGRGRM